ncbi:MAG TPA: hypothetical protein VK196_02620 [Magnetospirillum sp.]|nr:hypothetical protein [Magnetospirillum sp.]
MRLWRYAVLAMVAVVLQGCLGPDYQTTYQFTPPRSAEGRLCTSQCQQIRGYCRESCDNKGRDCTPAQESRHRSQCENDYRTCYQNCGGTVRQVTTCVSDCDEKPSRSSSSSSDSGLCRKGAHVEARSEGDWYPAVVNGNQHADGRCPVHYDGYGKEYDEALPMNSIRRPR